MGSDQLSKIYDRPQAVYLIRCQGQMPDGAPCQAFAALSLTEKSVCPACGKVYLSYPEYAATSRNKNLHCLSCDIPPVCSHPAAPRPLDDLFLEEGLTKPHQARPDRG